MSVYFYGCITLDGYLADKDHNLDWLYQTGTIEETGYDNFYEKMDITIMGRKTFNEILHMENPHLVYHKTENYVFTHAKELAVNGFKPVSGNIAEFVKNISSTKNIWIIGGTQILAPLLDNDMVDKMIIQIARADPKFSRNVVGCDRTLATLIKQLQTDLQNSIFGFVRFSMRH